MTNASRLTPNQAARAFFRLWNPIEERLSRGRDEDNMMDGSGDCGSMIAAHFDTLATREHAALMTRTAAVMRVSLDWLDEAVKGFEYRAMAEGLDRVGYY